MLVLAAGSAAPAQASVFSRGTSVEGRPIDVVVRGEPTAPVRILVVGCIHGNECDGARIARRLASARPLPGMAIFVIGTLNPDGRAAGTRGNAHGVDLNRNFAYGWRASTPGDPQYGGPRPLSEPETRFARRTIRRIRPTVTIWFHQPFGMVDLSGGNASVERRYARLVGLRTRRLPRYPGSATSWQNHAFPGTTAFVVELGGGHLSAGGVRRFAAAVFALGAALE